MVDEAQLAVLHERAARVARGVEEVAVGAVHDHADAVGVDAARDGELAERLVDGDQLVGDPGGSPRRGRHRGNERAEDGTGEPVAEELRHVLVQVEQQRHAAQLQRRGREGKEVGQGRHLHEPVVAAAMRARQLDGGEAGKGEVLGHVPREAGEGAVDGEAQDAEAAINLGSCLPGAPQAEEVDLVPGRDEGVDLAAEPRIPGIGGMRHQRDPDHWPLTSFQSRSLDSGERSARTRPRAAASASTRS